MEETVVAEQAPAVHASSSVVERVLVSVVWVPAEHEAVTQEPETYFDGLPAAVTHWVSLHAGQLDSFERVLDLLTATGAAFAVHETSWQLPALYVPPRAVDLEVAHEIWAALQAPLAAAHIVVVSRVSLPLFTMAG